MPRWFLSYHSPDQELAGRLEAALKRRDANAQVFFAPKSMRTGGFWLPQLAAELADATAFILLVGEHGIGQWQFLEYEEALDRRVRSPDFPLVLMLLEGQSAPGLPFLPRLHWITTADPASEESLARLHESVAGSANPPGELWRYTSPYRGLAAMTETDSEFFFGRQRETVEVLHEIADAPERLPVLLGNSGVGKSSLAQAGVLACLKRQAWPAGATAPAAWPRAFDGSRHWCFLKLTPGTEPLKALVEPFLRTWQIDAVDPMWEKTQTGWIKALLEGDATIRGLMDATERRHAELGQASPPAFFLYIDQGEELYVRSEERQQRRFSQLVAQALGDPRLRVIMSLRSDFLGALQNDEPLYAVHRQINVPPLREAELREVVSRPAALLGARFETAELPHDIARRTAEESAKDAGALPLLSYLLDDMWTQMVKRGDGVLRHPAAAFELGGVLTSRADAFLTSHPKAQEQLRRILTLKLATIREDGEPTRRRALRSEFSDEDWRLVSELADHPHRLLVTVAQENGETYAEVAHEAIFRRWNKLREWMAAERDFLVWKSSLEADRRQWSQASEATRNDALLMGLALAQAQSWLAKRAEDLPKEDREFIDLSLRRDALERQQREALRRRVLAVAIVALVVVTMLAILSVYEWRAAVQQEQMAQQERDRAEQAVATFVVRMVSMAQDGEHAEQNLSDAIARDPNDATSYFLRSMIYSQRKEYDRVIADLDNVVRLYPRFAFAYVARGYAYSEKKMYDRAIADFDAGIGLNPSNPVVYEWYRGRGSAYYDKGDIDRAIVEYDQSIKLNPKYASGYNNRGNAYYAKKEYDAAIADYSQAIAIDPKHADASLWYRHRGNAYFEKRDYDRALSDYDQAINLNPKFSLAYNNRGNAYYSKRDYDAAIADYSQAIAVDPNNADVSLWYRHRGNAYYEKQQYDSALSDYDEAIKLNPRFAVAYNNRGNAFFAKQDYGAAIASYDKAIEIDPRNAEAYVWYRNRGNAYYWKGDYDRTIADCEQAIALNPAYAESYNIRGHAYFQKDDFDRAIADYGMAIKLDSKTVVYYTNRGNALLAKQAYSLAIADYDIAIKLDPNNATAYGSRGLIYYFQSDYDQAIVDLDRAIELEPNNAEYFNNRGGAYRAKAEYDRAILDFDTALRLDPKFARALYNRGNVYRAKGDNDRATADYTRSIDLDPEEAGAFSAICWNSSAITWSQQALEACNESLRLRANDAYALDGRGRAYLGLDDPGKAEPDFDAALKMESKLVSSLYGRGVARHKKGDTERAVADFTRVLELDPKHIDARIDRASVNTDKGEYERAIEDYTEVIHLDPTYWDAWNGRCYARAIVGRLTEALEDCSEGLRLQPEDAQLLDSRGFTYLKMGRLDEAIADYDAALKFDPKLAESLYGRGLAKLKKGDVAGGNDDIAAAKAIRANIAEQFARYGIQ